MCHPSRLSWKQQDDERRRRTPFLFPAFKQSKVFKLTDGTKYGNLVSKGLLDMSDEAIARQLQLPRRYSWLHSLWKRAKEFAAKGESKSIVLTVMRPVETMAQSLAYLLSTPTTEPGLIFAGENLIERIEQEKNRLQPRSCEERNTFRPITPHMVHINLTYGRRHRQDSLGNRRILERIEEGLSRYYYHNNQLKREANEIHTQGKSAGGNKWKRMRQGTL